MEQITIEPSIMGGILKNKQDQKENLTITDDTKEFRSQVLKNTKLNALLKNSINPNILNEAGEIDPSRINELSEEDKEKLKWNAQNLQDNEIIQKQIIENLGQTIDEPKTPFQKAAQPELNEYYQDDDEVEDLNNFSLGEPELKVDELDQKFDIPVNPEEQDDQRNEDDEEIEDEEVSKPKKSFDELRKQHYHHEHLPALSKAVEIEEESDNEEEEEEEPKPKKSFAELRKQHYHNEHVPVVSNDDE